MCLRTRPDTWLPKSHAGGQRPYLRSLDHLGRSSEKAVKKERKKEKKERRKRKQKRTSHPRIAHGHWSAVPDALLEVIKRNTVVAKVLHGQQHPMPLGRCKWE